MGTAMGTAMQGGVTSPLYVIVKGSMVPVRSPAFVELARIRSVGEFVEVDQPTVNLPRGRAIFVCGASRWISVHEQYMQLRQLGYDVSVHEPGAYVLDYDGA